MPATAHPCLHAQGSSIEAYNRNRAEIRRLQCLDAIGNKAYIDARAESSQASATLTRLQDALAAVQSQGMRWIDPEQIRHDVQARQHAKEQAFVELQLAKTGCGRLADAAAAMQHTSFLLGDYKLKLARQDYVTSRQDTLIARLLEQRAREELVKGLFALDQSQHNETEVLFKSITVYIDRHSNDSKRRIAAMKEAAKLRAAQKHMVHSNDHTLLRLHRILLQPEALVLGEMGDGAAAAADGDSFGVSIAGGAGAVLAEHHAVVQAAIAVHANAAEAASKRDAALRQQSAQMHLLESRLHRYERLAWGHGNAAGDGAVVGADSDRESASTGAEGGLLRGCMPELTSPAIRGKMTTLQSNIEALTAIVKRLNEQIKQHEHELRSATSVRPAKSNLMALFFTDPDRLPGQDYH